MNNRGGSIGYGLPVALGAAIACPDRKVLALAKEHEMMTMLFLAASQTGGRFK